VTRSWLTGLLRSAACRLARYSSRQSGMVMVGRGAVKLRAIRIGYGAVGERAPRRCLWAPVSPAGEIREFEARPKSGVWGEAAPEETRLSPADEVDGAKRDILPN
jgi:hypothetical protein